MRELVDSQDERERPRSPVIDFPAPNQESPPMKAETMLAELNRLRKDLDEDKSDIEWLTLHHVFAFVSYKMGDFQKYLDEASKRGEFEEFEK
jgi:hypothetical protein